MHVRDRNVQLVGDHLAEHGHGALTCIALAAVHNRAAVLIDFDPNGRAVPISNGSVAAHMHGGGHAHTAFYGAIQWGGQSFLMPFHGSGGLLEAFQ